MLGVLVAVASLLAHQPVQVSCGPLPPNVGSRALGAAQPAPDPHIWLRPWVCRGAYHLEPYATLVYAHEIIHVQHPAWSEARVHYWDGWYARNVVRRVLAGHGAAP